MLESSAARSGGAGTLRKLHGFLKLADLVETVGVFEIGDSGELLAFGAFEQLERIFVAVEAEEGNGFGVERTGVALGGLYDIVGVLEDFGMVGFGFCLGKGVQERLQRLGSVFGGRHCADLQVWIVEGGCGGDVVGAELL